MLRGQLFGIVSKHTVHMTLPVECVRCSHDPPPPSSLPLLPLAVLVAELYASNYDNVSRPCSTAAAGLQPETGYQPAG